MHAPRRRWSQGAWEVVKRSYQVWLVDTQKSSPDSEVWFPHLGGYALRNGCADDTYRDASSDATIVVCRLATTSTALDHVS